jgi:hypothetical protein
MAFLKKHTLAAVLLAVNPGVAAQLKLRQSCVTGCLALQQVVAHWPATSVLHVEALVPDRVTRFTVEQLYCVHWMLVRVSEVQQVLRHSPVVAQGRFQSRLPWRRLFDAQSNVAHVYNVTSGLFARQHIEPHWDGMSLSHWRDNASRLAVMLSVPQLNDVHGNGGRMSGGVSQHLALQSSALAQNRVASVRRCLRLALVQL